MANTWFNESYYLSSKLAQLQKTEPTNTQWQGSNALLNLSSAIKAAGMTAESHFLAFGSTELTSPNKYFNAEEYLAAKAVQSNADKVNGQSDWTAQTVALAINQAGMSVYEHFQKFGWKEGVNPSNAFDTAKYFEAKLAQLKEAEPAAEWTLEKVKAAFEAAGTNPVDHALTFGAAEGVAIVPATNPVNGGTPGAGTAVKNLTAGQDNEQGSAGNDTFYAKVLDNQNTLQNGDSIDGGAGNDTLRAEIGNSQKFAIQPELKSVENVVISARATSKQGVQDNTDNNTIAGGNAVQIDAGKSVGVQNWESNDSRADLIIEDVRLDFVTQNITKDVTITFRDSDPGDVDYAVYFDQQSLLSEAGQLTTSLTVQISNPLETAKGFDAAKPLKDVPYDTFNFVLNGKPVSLTINLKGVETYDQLETALQAALSTYPEVSMARAKDAVSFSARDGQARTADVFTLTVDKGTITPNVTDGWNASAGLPSNNSFSAIVEQGVPSETNPLITSTIVLDNVGRGSTGGDLVVGGLSAGLTSTSKGVEKFDITVEQSSKLQSISSTSNTLKEVTLVNSGVHKDVVNGKLVERVGNLTLLGNVDVAGFGYDTAVGKTPLPGSAADQAIVGADSQFNGFGLTDVRIVDASTFAGDIALSAVLSQNVTDKYLNLKDGAPAQAAVDNVAFNYNLGSGNDKLALAISSANLHAAGTTTREDFNLNINTGNGDDIVEVVVSDFPGIAATNKAWYANSQINANLRINTGEGNDTVHTHGGGDWVVKTGAGNDTVYLNNAGQKAQWIVNGQGTSIDDITSNPSKVYAGAMKLELTVSMKLDSGETYTAKAEVPSNAATTNSLQINQAIKAAIQNDAVLSKLLLATDGPANSLVVKSLIDGAYDATSGLTFSLAAPSVAQLTPADVTAWNTANPGNTVASVIELAAKIAVPATFAADHNVVQEKAGVNSVFTSDNTVEVGNGNDIVVLATDALSNDKIVFEGYGLGTTTVVNFEATGTGADRLDFSSYLGRSITANTDTIAEANSVSMLGFTAQPGQTFDGLTADVLLAALNSTNTGTANFGGLTAASLDAAVTTTAGKAVVLVQNGTSGVYKAFELSFAGDTSGNFSKAELISTTDFGNALSNWQAAVTNVAAGGGTGGGTSPVPPVPGAPVPVAVAPGATALTATADADVFSLDVANLLADTAGTNTQATITGFDVAADKLSFNLPTADAAITTLAQLNGVQGVSVQYDPFANLTLVNLGNDANGGEVVTISLMGVADASTVAIEVI